MDDDESLAAQGVYARWVKEGQNVPIITHTVMGGDNWAASPSYGMNPIQQYAEREQREHERILMRQLVQRYSYTSPHPASGADFDPKTRMYHYRGVAFPEEMLRKMDPSVLDALTDGSLSGHGLQQILRRAMPMYTGPGSQTWAQDYELDDLPMYWSADEEEEADDPRVCAYLAERGRAYASAGE